MSLIKREYYLILLTFILFFANHQILCEGEEPVVIMTIPTTILTTYPIFCDCETGANCNETECINCNSKVRYFYQNYSCLACNDISSQKPYFTLNENGVCVTKTGKTETSQKLIDGTKEIVSSCGGSYSNQLGDICYKEINGNAVASNNDEPSIPSIYNCIYYFYKTIRNGFTYYNCLAENITCPTSFKYYDYSTKECLSSCNSSYFLKKETNDETYIYRCSETCLGTAEKKEFIYAQYCFDVCPQDKKYYNTFQGVQNITECLEKCDPSKFVKGNECIDTCENYTKVDTKNNIYSCLDSSTTCPSDYPYKYESCEKTYCLKSCADTTNNYFSKNNTVTTNITYIFENNSNSQIVKTCVSENPGTDKPYYIDLKALKWVDDCKKATSGPYHNDTYCLNSCGDSYIISDELQCVDDCYQENTDTDNTNDYIYKDITTKTCYKECPANLGRGYYNDTTKECQTCDVPNGENITVGKEGYHQKNNNTCLLSCEEGFYHNDNDNICFQQDCKTTQRYKYQPFGINICYQSCFDISGGLYNIELDYVCYQHISNITENLDNYYFYNNNGIIKYINKINYKECIQANLKYVKNNECVSSCNGSDYRIEPSSDKIGMCFESKPSFPIESNNTNLNYSEYLYYDNSKIISNKCNNYKIVDNNGLPNATIEENCVSVCPADFIYINETGKICQSTCNAYILEEGDGIKCIDTCNKFIKNVETLSYCVSKCKVENDTKFSFYDTNKTCLDSCNVDDNPDKFALDPINDHQLCINNCSIYPSYPYYNEDEKICRKDCPDFYSKDKTTCVKNCSDGEYIHPGNICSDSPCPSNAPFHYVIDSPARVKQCVPNCASIVGKNYTYYNVSTIGSGEDEKEEKECIENCVAPFNLTYESRCYDTCPEGLYENNNICISNCQPNYYIKESDNKLKCVPGCPIEGNIYHTSSGECADFCPAGESYIKGDNNCSSSCESNDFYEKFNASGHDNYKCLSNCTGKVYINGTRECIDNCSDLYEYDGKCFRNCLNVEGHPFSTKDNDGKKICSDECNSTEPYFENDKICRSECMNLYSNKIINDTNNTNYKYCISECDLKTDYKFLNNITNDAPETGYTLFCRTKCEDNKRYLGSNYKCRDTCPESNNFIVEDGNNAVECLNKCPEGNEYARLNYTSNEYKCSSEICNKTSNEYYYLNDKKCISLSECGGDFIIIDNINNNICTQTCGYYNNTKLYYFEKNDTNPPKQCVFDCNSTEYKYTRRNGSCRDTCEEEDYYDEEDKICLIKCPNGKKIDGHICRTSCNETNCENKYEDENGYCVANCSLSEIYKYHNENEYKCLKDCSNLYIEDDICKSTCSDDRYIYDKTCVLNCPDIKRYFSIINKTCLTDCPKDYPYFTITTQGPYTLYKCSNTCGAYLPSSSSNMNAKECLGNDCPSTGDENTFYVKENENQKICYNECPLTHNFIDGNECLQQCPDRKVHLPGEYNCTNWEECESGIIKYNSKECVQQCSKNDIIYEYNYNSKTIKFCVDNCSIAETISGKEAHTLRLTYDNQCVETCPGFSEIEGDTCVCRRLFYYNKTTGYKECLNKDLTLCESIPDFPIIKVEDNECTNYCDGILSLSGTECYNNTYKCGQDEEIKTLINGNKVCDCKYKYYTVVENGREVKKCLAESEECPSEYPLLIKETKECIAHCPENNYEYGKTCVLKCPSGTKEEGRRCKCSGKWYVSENSDLVCVSGECPTIKYLYVEATKECVSTCKGTNSTVYFNKTCINDCSGGDRQKVTSDDNYLLKDISTHYCKCKDDQLWFYDMNGYDICSDKSSCNDINFKYIIPSTKQCVNSCPETYYRFNDECLYKCGTEHIQDETSKLCTCKDLWKYTDEKRIKKECINTDICPEGYLTIVNTKECYEGTSCPSEYAQFEDKCYDKDKCPEDVNTKYDEIAQKCVCAYKWYKESGKEKCLSKDSDCPLDYQYLNIATNECTKALITEDSDKRLYEFNYIFYSNCPENTTIDEANPTKCICDPLLGYWYEDQDLYGKNILQCGKMECPTLKPYNIYQQKKCLSLCPEEYRYLYQGMCYSKCPDLTEPSSKGNECQLKTVDTEINLQNLEKAMSENIVDLYKKSTNFNLNANRTSVGQKIVTQNATVEFYGVNKKNKGLTNQNIQSDLSYIDISDCIDKIYKSNKMEEKDDIVILKFDVNKVPNKYLINPVEYKLINSRTGQELDASVCEHNSIRISYPVHDLINKYDKMFKSVRKLEYIKIDLTSNNKDSLREKLDKGKEIYDEYPNVDIFDNNNKIYSDICIAVEVDGKDLVLEDRIDYFYPQLSLCENNCTYNRTDFTNERIYCDCSYKTEFDFEREYSSSFELNTNQVKSDQSGNSNIAIMKCISNLKNSKSISKNYGFIYSLIIIILEVLLLCIIAFYGINALLAKLKAKMDKNSEHYDNIEANVLNTNDNKKTYEDIKTSERNLNNPPKKKKDFDMEFIPKEYLFLFFNQGEKDSIKKVERDNVPFKTKFNTRILLEQKKGFNYNNVKPTGPFPPGQNILVIVDNMDEDINDYLGLDESFEEEKKKRKKLKDEGVVNIRSNLTRQTKKSKSKSQINQSEKEGIQINQKPKMYYKNRADFTISDYDPSDENYSVYDIDEEDDVPHEKGFIETLKSNQRIMRRNYEIAVKNKNINFVEVLFTEILDKIYITKILFFTRKFDIFSLQLSIYLLCHLILLVFNTLFFDVKTIKNIWKKENYPGLGYYLGYGFLSCIIVWLIYTVFLCLLTNNDKIKELLKLIHFNNKYNMNKGKIITKKYKNLEWKIKFKFGIYTLIEFILLIFSFLYLTVFSTVYTGTQSKTFKEYGIALIEILIIKILYAIALAIMRYISLTKQKKGLYDVVLFMNTYLV